MDWPTRRNFSSGSVSLKPAAASGYSSFRTFWQVYSSASPPRASMTSTRASITFSVSLSSARWISSI